MDRVTDRILNEVNRVVLGKQEVVRKVLLAILAQGHVLLEDVPGVGKTTMANAFAKTLGMETKRVQFTSDTMPSDVVGFSVYDKASGALQYGSIFSVNTLADDLHLDMKRQTEELQKIGKSISELKKVHTDVQGKTVPEKEVCQGLLKELAARRCGEDGQAGRSRNGNQCAVGSETR